MSISFKTSEKKTSDPTISLKKYFQIYKPTVRKLEKSLDGDRGIQLHEKYKHNNDILFHVKAIIY